MKLPQDIVICPLISEKSYDLINQNKYSFKVHPKANKVEIGKAIEAIFKVTVVDVNTLAVKGKFRRQGYTSGYRSNWKKAVVTLRKGDKIEFFEGK